MARKAEDVYRDALELDEIERERLLEMLASVRDGFATRELEAYWAEEAERRLDELERSGEAMIPAEEVFRRARERFSR